MGICDRDECSTEQEELRARISELESLLARWYDDPGIYMNDEEIAVSQALIQATTMALRLTA